MKEIFETERLTLRTPQLGFEEMIMRYYIRNKDFLKEWEYSKEEVFYTLEYQRKELEKQIKRHNDGGAFSLWIFEKGNDERIIGALNFSNIIRGVFQSCYVGYKMDGFMINRGYMAEALKKGIEVAFQQLKLHRIEANIMPKNMISLRVVEKLGFKNEGIAEKYLKINGIWEDHIHMVLINDNM